VVLQATVTILCPEECRCDLGGLYVDCSDLSLSNIPLIFPTDVRKLVLDNNSITSLEKDSFVSKELTELWHLTVSRCGLEKIELGAFNGLTKLTHLSMSFNQISEILPHTFEKMSRLEYLELAYNRFEHLEVEVFLELITLKHTYLETNKLQYLHPDMFVGLPNLERLELAHTPDLKIPTDVHFKNSRSLSRLDISDCNVSSLSVEAFPNVSALERLDLSYNNLSSVDINILKVLPKLSALHLYANPLQCNCQLQDVWRWCQDHNTQTASGQTAPECDTPSDVQGIWWGVLEKGQCLQDNIYYYGYYENSSYSYNPAENTDKKTEWDLIRNRCNFLKYVKTLVYAVSFVFGTTGNAILLIIIICNKDMRTVPNMYILNLGISGMIYLMVYFADSCATIISDTWLQSDITCNFFTFCSLLSVGLSAYSVAVFSIQRYRVTVNPFHVRDSSQPTWRVTVATICEVWIVAALFALPLNDFVTYSIVTFL
jgi:Leucine-rich repeat (LRR) protein